MGVIYKLKPEIRDFILEKKKSEPNLSCRQISNFILDKFQIKLSKSRVNSIIKEAGLSMPVGRRRKKRRHRPEIAVKPQAEIKIEVPVETETPVEEKPLEIPVEAPAVQIEAELPSELACTGAILLKAADCLINGSQAMLEAIQNRIGGKENNLLSLTEGLMYLPLFGKDRETKDLSELWALINKQFSLDQLLSYLNELQEVKTIPLDISKVISAIFQEVHCAKVTLSDASNLYLDGQLHTVWSTPHIPYDFSTTLYNIKSYVNKYFQGDSPFILFMAPGYDTPTKEFVDFILNLDAGEKWISRLTLYGNKFEELETIHLERGQGRSYIFGLWPWQFIEYRKVKTIEEFKPFHFAALKEDFYLANIEIELSQPTTNQRVTLRGCALKKALTEKTRLIILSNFSQEKTAEEIANMYLSHWPNLDEAFQDYSRKIELFTYTAASQHFFSTENLTQERNLSQDLKGLFDDYLKALDLYVRWHFLPLGYENKDFSTVNAQFYALNCQLKRQKDLILATFKPPEGYPFLKDLAYACRRINEREIVFSDGRRLWLESAF